MLVDVSNLPLVACHAALDLVNTVEPRIAGEEPERDHLTDPAALLVWAGRAGLAAETELAAVAEAWERAPGSGEAALDAVREIRESLYAAMVAAMGLVSSQAPGTSAALERLHTRWLAAVGRSTFRLDPAAVETSNAGQADVRAGESAGVAPAAGQSDARAAESATHATPRLVVGMAPALLVPDRAADAAYNLLFATDLTRLGRCPTEEGGCGWLFLDHSRNRSRRWCRMADCGTEVKARRLTERRRATRTSQTSRTTRAATTSTP